MRPWTRKSALIQPRTSLRKSHDTSRCKQVLKQKPGDARTIAQLIMAFEWAGRAKEAQLTRERAVKDKLFPSLYHRPVQVYHKGVVAEPLWPKLPACVED